MAFGTVNKQVYTYLCYEFQTDTFTFGGKISKNPKAMAFEIMN